MTSTICSHPLHRLIPRSPKDLPDNPPLSSMISNFNAKAWQDDSELALVRDWFYPGKGLKDPYNTLKSADMRKEAIANVNTWTFRSHKVPPAVLSTADLNDSILHYEDLEQSGDFNQYRCVQFMFAFAFLRFVNGFVDRDIAKSADVIVPTGEVETEEERNGRISGGESSMYAHAMAIGMPEKFVDLRHQVSHGKIPEVRILKRAADEALEWLWERWWKGNATADSTVAAQKLSVDNFT